jgi:hypothetical protein
MRLLKSGRLSVYLAMAGLLLIAPSPVTAQEATPAATPAPSGSNAQLLSFLRQVPDIMSSDNPPQGEIAEFADVALQLAAIGASSPTSADDPNLRDWIRATMWLALPQDLQTRALDPQWRALFGFDVFQVDQSLVAGEPPNQITYLRGRFDPNEVTTALTKSQYKAVDIEGVQAYSLFPDPTIDLDNPVSQLALARMNNAVILADGTLVFTSTLDAIREVVAVSKGEALSLASRVDVPALAQAMPRPLASAILIPGSNLSLSSMSLNPTYTPAQLQDFIRQVQQSGEMPPVSMALLGVSAGGPLLNFGAGGTPEASPVAEAGESAVFDIGLLTFSPGQARTAEQTIATRMAALSSLVTLRPYAEMFTSVQPAGPADLPIAVVELTFSAESSPRIWTQLLPQRDLLFLGW